MKLLRYGSVGSERPGILDGNGIVRDLSGIVDTIDGPATSLGWLARLRAHAIIKPRGSTKLDWEVELALVIGSDLKALADSAHCGRYSECPSVRPVS
jgi:hypothetical protein